MKWVIPLFIFTLSINVLAAKSSKSEDKKGLYTYSYNNKDIYFNSNQYHRYIEPQLETLVENFYSVIKDSHPVQKDILVFRKDFLKQSNSIRKELANCFTPTFDCEGQQWREIHQKTLVLNQIVTNFNIQINSLKIKHERFLDNYMSFVSNARPRIFKFLSLIEKQIISGDFKDNLSHEFISTYTFINTNLNLLMTSLIDNPKNRIFYGLWNNFIGPIESYLKDQSGKDKLKKTLVDLNVQWNSFHFQIDREHISMDPKAKRMLKQMHRRWTLVLKVIVG